MNGGHGQIVLLHVVKESKQEAEHVLMMLQTLASYSQSKRIATFLQRNGDLGPVAQQHVAKVVKQELEPALIIS